MKVIFVRIALIGWLLLAWACSESASTGVGAAATGGEAAGGGRLGAAYVVPDHPTSETDLEVEVVVDGPMPARLTYQWFKNDEPIPGAIRERLASNNFKRGDFIAVRVQAAGTSQAVTSEAVMIGNSPPVISWAGIVPNPATSSTDLRALAAARDADGDPVQYSFNWLVNEEPLVEVTGRMLPHHYLHRGDLARVEVRPFDGTDWGEPVRSPPVRIDNSPPVIRSTPPQRLAGEVYRYAVQAEDADGDPLAFALKGEPPPGMQIDPATGEITWPIQAPPGAVTYRYQVVAEDGHGGRCIQNIELSYSPELPGQAG